VVFRQVAATDSELEQGGDEAADIVLLSRGFAAAADVVVNLLTGNAGNGNLKTISKMAHASRRSLM